MMKFASSLILLSIFISSSLQEDGVDEEADAVVLENTKSGKSNIDTKIFTSDPLINGGVIGLGVGVLGSLLVGSILEGQNNCQTYRGKREEPGSAASPSPSSRFLPGLTGNNNCPPSTYSNGFNNGYSVHNNGYNVPNNGYNVPNNGYNVPNNGYGYNQGYNGINQGYNVPNVGYNAHAQGYQQPGLNSGYSSPQQIHITAQQGYNNGYNTQTGYNSPQTGYNSPQLGYNQHQTGYNQGYNQNFQPTGYPPVPNSGYNSGFVSAVRSGSSSSTPPGARSHSSRTLPTPDSSAVKFGE